MRFCILSDIHGNLEALTTVLEDSLQENADAYLCAGDVVGYGADPGECVRIVTQRCLASVAGNHDWAVLEKIDIGHFNPFASEAIHWTRAHVTPEARAALASWPLVYRNEHLVMVHSSLDRPETFDYLLYADQARQTFLKMDRRVCFIGHTHIPVIFEEANGKVARIDVGSVQMRGEARYIVNVGSVGQPRDGDPRAAYAIVDTGTGTVAIKRVAYDIALAQEKIRRAGLPGILADRLSAGY